MAVIFRRLRLDGDYQHAAGIGPDASRAACARGVGAQARSASAAAENGGRSALGAPAGGGVDM